MSLTIVAENTTTPTVGTPVTLATDTTNQIYVLVVDTAAMVNGDELVLTINTIARSAGAARVAYRVVYKHAQAQPMKYSPPVPADISFAAVLNQTAGTARAFPWKILHL